MYQLGYGRGVVDLKTHAAQLGWNACNPSLLSGFAFCWHIYFKRPPFFISSAWLAHTHPWTNTYTRLTSHLYTLFPLPVFFPLAVHPVNSYVLHGFTHKLCLFWLCTVLWLAYYPTLFLNYLYSDWCVFHVCNWIVCFIHSGIGAWGQRPPSQPLPPLVVCTGLMCCTYWTICSCLTVPATSWRTMPHVPYSITCIHLHTRKLIYTLTTTCIPCQSLYTLKLWVCTIERFKKT